jgi:lysophospholipase L1-like esterase
LWYADAGRKAKKEIVGDMTAPNSMKLAAALILGLSIGVAQTQIGRPPLSPIPAPPPRPPVNNPGLPSVFVIGDSTASNGERNGWGDPFADYFDATRINAANRAVAGFSSRSFITVGLWDRVLKEMKSGDFVLLQMGQNDGGTLDTGRARGSLPGLGEDTKEVTMPDGKTELVHTYGWYMRKYIADTKAKGATIIVMSLTAKNIFRDGKNVRVYDNFSKWAAEVAQSAGAAFLDHIDIVANEYDKLGQEKVRGLFTDSTHTTAVGADMNASFVVAGLRTLNSPLVQYLSAKGQAVPAYDPSVTPPPIPAPAAAPQGVAPGRGPMPG